MSKIFGLFGCFKGKNASDSGGKRTIQENPSAVRGADPSQTNRNSRVLPSHANGSQNDMDLDKVCARCGRTLDFQNKSHTRVGSVGRKADLEVT